MTRRDTVLRVGIAAAHAACTLAKPLGIHALRRLGLLAGDIAWRAEGRAVRTTCANIDAAFAHRDVPWRRDLARASIRHTAMTASEAIALWTWPLARLATLTQNIVGEHLLRDRARGRGAMVLVPHFGNWEYIGYCLNAIEPLVPLYEPPASPVVDRALRAARARLGHRSATTSVSGLRLLVQALRRGAMVAVLPDQVPTVGGGVAAEFFNRPAHTMTLIAKLLRRVDADVFIAHARRVEGGFDVRIDTVDEAIRDPDPQASARIMNAAIEAVVAADPAQYQWEYKRYRFPGRPNMYG